MEPDVLIGLRYARSPTSPMRTSGSTVNGISPTELDSASPSMAERRPRSRGRRRSFSMSSFHRLSPPRHSDGTAATSPSPRSAASALFPVQLRHLGAKAFRPAIAARVPSLIGLALALSFVSPAFAAKAAPPTPKDSAPVLMSRTGGGGSWENLAELQRAAQKGNPKAEAQLGEMLLRGDGIAKDETRAVALLEKAARAGHSGAAFRIGMLLANGEHGVVKDPTRALAYFRAGAAGGEAEAFFNIGAAYASARGVKRDYAEALGWLIVARQHGANASTEQALRAQIKSQTAWIATGERRAKEIEGEFAGKKVVDFLPSPAPLDEPVSLKPTFR